jgi:hypothetical protein
LLTFRPVGITAAGALTKPAWQAGCVIYEHNINNKCTKTLSFKDDDDDAELLAMWRLRQWLNCGVRAATKEAHFGCFKAECDHLPNEDIIGRGKVVDLMLPEGVAAPTLAAAAPLEAEDAAAVSDQGEMDERGPDSASSTSSTYCADSKALSDSSRR